MGSSARHSTGRKAGSLHARKRKQRQPRQQPAPSTPDTTPTTAALRQLEEGYAIAVTAHASLVYSGDPIGDVSPDSGEIALALEHGLRIIRQAADALDVATREVQS